MKIVTLAYENPKLSGYKISLSDIILIQKVIVSTWYNSPHKESIN